ncbi:Uncharacterized NAD(P)/FAD-binding protein YdhS [Daejeonella rubra]|uniref:Uncharacterized NAD(P)/FAD-binding protein YdhS n=1 Tax=Daejeonella rubra TaxID=990371 RepID=A0A1G9XWU3_9SPHI|nr:FAD/NAD(P)-binding protein [Daejeonella rubra]SDN01248.1 Uncharacterized NAD(P)/FAD-binding protein YdhS [Daejeonella rubra]
MLKIAIIGGGFSGTLLSTHLVRNAAGPMEVILINESDVLNTGIAYDPYSEKFLLNVIASRMSAFPADPDHFLNWVMLRDHFKGKERELIGNSYLPRKLYGEYLKDIWEETLRQAKENQVAVRVINSAVVDISHANDSLDLILNDGKTVQAEYGIIASGNHLPGNPQIKSSFFKESSNYFQNPWDRRSVSDLNSNKPVLIIGNGLTMVDTVMGLLEQGFSGQIISISPNGFNILPHRHNGLAYTKLLEEISSGTSLYQLVKLFNIHKKLVRAYGLSAEPIIDSLRPLTQKIWMNLTIREKRVFMARLRHLWGVARHRIPLNIHDKLQQLRIDGQLHIYSGKISDIVECQGDITAMFFDKKQQREVQIQVSRVINCTGPETDLLKLETNYLKNALLKGVLSQDELKLGINADPNTFELINEKGSIESGLFTIGSNLKGVLWESTAVSEIRVQAVQIANRIHSLNTQKLAFKILSS